jgi:hypothetical protein
MAISRKPKTTEKPIKEQDINALINKGGSTAENGSKKEGDKPILIRVPPDTLEMIDKIVASKKIKTPRHTWLLEAVFEKLEREG